MSNMYKRRPSEILFIEDEYTAFCLDQACAYIIQKLSKNEEPQFKVKYKSFSEIYEQYETN